MWRQEFTVYKVHRNQKLRGMWTLKTLDMVDILAAQGTKSTQTKLEHSGLLDRMPGPGAPEGESAN